MKKTVLLATVACMAVAIAGVAERVVELVDSNDLSMWAGKVLPNSEFRLSGGFSFETFGKYATETIYKEFIPIEHESAYTLSCYMRSMNADNPASGNFGLRMYDKDKRAILICHVDVQADTHSELASAAASGDRHLLVRHNSKWLESKHSSIAFNAREDYSDLPNFDLSPRVVKTARDGDNLKVTLSSPLRKDYPAGTAVRLHNPWGAPFYGAASGWMPTEWKEFTIFIKGEAEHGTPRGKFWRGTRYVKPFFWFGNWNKKPREGARLLVNNVRFSRHID